MTTETRQTHRTRHIVRMERLLLAARYGALCGLAGLALLGSAPLPVRGLVLIVAWTLLHNAFTHAALWSRKPALFQTPLNYLAHLVTVTGLVWLCGGIRSEGYVLFAFFLVAASAYTRHPVLVLIEAVVLLGAGAALAAGEWLRGGAALSPAEWGARAAAIAAAGALSVLLVLLIRRLEGAARGHEDALAFQTALFQSVLDTAVDPVFIYTDRGAVTETNAKACEFLAVPRDQIVGAPFRSFLFDDGTLDTTLARIHGQPEHRGEMTFVDAEGEEHDVEVHIRALTHRGDTVRVAAVRDISEYKSLEEAAHLANVNLARLNRELQQVNELKTGLLRILSQRIRSPLTALLGHLELLLDESLGELKPDQRKALQACRRCGLRVVRLLEEVFGEAAFAGRKTNGS